MRGCSLLENLFSVNFNWNALALFLLIFGSFGRNRVLQFLLFWFTRREKVFEHLKKGKLVPQCDSLTPWKVYFFFFFSPSSFFHVLSCFHALSFCYVILSFCFVILSFCDVILSSFCDSLAREKYTFSPWKQLRRKKKERQENVRLAKNAWLSF